MGDMQLFYHLATQGKLGYIRERMVTYRIRASSISSYDNPEKARQFAQQAMEARIRLVSILTHPEGGEEYKKQAEAKLHAPPAVLSFSTLLRKKISGMKRFFRGDYANFRKYLALSPAERVRMFVQS